MTKPVNTRTERKNYHNVEKVIRQKSNVIIDKFLFLS